MSDDKGKLRPGTRQETQLIHTAMPPSPRLRTVLPPVERGSTVMMPNAASLYDDDAVTYGRGGLAVQRALCAALADMEGAAGCQLFPSGLSAVTGSLLAVLKAGDQLLASDTIYNPTRRFCEKVLRDFGVEVGFYPASATPDEIFAMATPALRVVLIESPGSLTFEIIDVEAVAAGAKARGALTIVDNTWAAGLLFQPLAHGADISVQALTKYVCGHSDVFMGSSCVRGAELAKTLDEAIWNFGWSVSPDDAYQALRGLRTLPTRIAKHGENGLTVARWLREQPQVLKVIHPGLPGDASHALWSRDYSGACGLFGLVLQPGSETAVNAFLDVLTLFGLGFSWGGFESLAIPSDHQLGKRRYKPKLGGPLVRIHVGLEDAQDLIADLKVGLAAFDGAR